MPINDQGATIDISRKIESKQFLEWLTKAGIIPESTRRVVIDASAGEPVIIYTEQYGTEALISVDPPPELQIGIKVNVSEERAMRAKHQADYPKWW